jgi:hypothetical protein
MLADNIMLNMSSDKQIMLSDNIMFSDKIMLSDNIIMLHITLHHHILMLSDNKLSGNLMLCFIIFPESFTLFVLLTAFVTYFSVVADDSELPPSPSSDWPLPQSGTLGILISSVPGAAIIFAAAPAPQHF